MSDRLSDVRRRIASTEQLGSVINAMRGMAAVHAAQARSLIPGVHAYRDIALRAIVAAISLEGGAQSVDHAHPERCLIVLGPEQGFCGALADRVLEAAAPHFEQARVLIVGSRLASLAQDQDYRFARSFALPTRADGLTRVAIEISDAVEAWIAGVRRPEVRMVLPRWTAGGDRTIEFKKLLPLDPSAMPKTPDSPPLIQIPAAQLLQDLAAEYLFAHLCEGLAETLAAENQSRMTTMAAASSGIGKRLDKLRGEERLTRQEEITAEVVELAAGAQARSRV